jgi:SAM-dependent methyltransferase
MPESSPRPGGIRRSLERRVGHLVFGSRRWVERELRSVAASLHGARILEIGSGRHELGDDAYSFKHLFPEDNEFVQSDVNPAYGHLVVDVTQMEFVDEWDLILCVSVLEHLRDHDAAAERIYRALKPGGRAVVVAPMCFPYHDEPEDYWRFTIHGVRAMLGAFEPLELKCRGPRRLPFATLAIAHKPVATASSSASPAPLAPTPS